MPISEILDSKMPSLTEWLEKMNAPQAAEFRREDNSKRDRLEILFQTIGLPYDRPERMMARDITDNSALFLDILKRKGDELCAFRLIPLRPDLPKLRVRGKTLKENLGWFFQQNVNPDDYKVEVVPHSDDTLFSAIFVITDTGAFGEIVPGLHWQLTQGIYNQEPLTFSFDFDAWKFSRENEDLRAVAVDAIGRLKIDNGQTRSVLEEKLSSEFSARGYLRGYFEFVVFPEIGLMYIDYNRLLDKFCPFNFDLDETKNELGGVCASAGRATGRARIVTDPEIADFDKDSVLVCPMTDIRYLPLMKKAAAIVCEQGGILSHAAIVARELKKPCVVGVKDALKKIKNGDLIEVNGDTGEIKILEKAA